MVMVTNDHSHMTVKQAAEVVNINKAIHYAHTQNSLYVHLKRGKTLPSTPQQLPNVLIHTQNSLYVHLERGKTLPSTPQCSCYNNLKSTKFLSQCNVCISPSTSYNTKGQTYRDRQSTLLSLYEQATSATDRQRQTD